MLDIFLWESRGLPLGRIMACPWPLTTPHPLIVKPWLISDTADDNANNVTVVGAESSNWAQKPVKPVKSNGACTMTWNFLRRRKVWKGKLVLGTKCQARQGIMLRRPREKKRYHSVTFSALHHKNIFLLRRRKVLRTWPCKDRVMHKFLWKSSEPTKTSPTVGNSRPHHLDTSDDSHLVCKALDGLLSLLLRTIGMAGISSWGRRQSRSSSAIVRKGRPDWTRDDEAENCRLVVGQLMGWRAERAALFKIFGSLGPSQLRQLSGGRPLKFGPVWSWQLLNNTGLCNIICTVGMDV